MAQCQPVNIASDQNAPLGISVSSLPKHSDYVYWVNQSPPSLWRARKDGSSPAPQANTTGLVQMPFDIAVDEEFLYWSEVKDRQVYRRPLDGGGTRFGFLPSGGDAGFIDVEAPDLYASNYEPASSQGAIVTTAEALFMGPFVVGGLAVRSQVVYWIRQESNAIVAPADRDPKGVSKFGSQTPMKRPAQPEEIAPAFVFLAAPSCSSYITGEILPIIGGYSGG